MSQPTGTYSIEGLSLGQCEQLVTDWGFRDVFVWQDGRYVYI